MATILEIVVSWKDAMLNVNHFFAYFSLENTVFLFITFDTNNFILGVLLLEKDKTKNNKTKTTTKTHHQHRRGQTVCFIIFITNCDKNYKLGGQTIKNHRLVIRYYSNWVFFFIFCLAHICQPLLMGFLKWTSHTFKFKHT